MTSDPERLINDGGRLLLDSLSQGMRRGIQAFDSMRDRRAGCCCEIPPPCWYPRPAGKVRSHVCCGGRATLCIRVTNCGVRPATIKLEASGPAGVEIEPATLELGPMERGTATAKLELTGREADRLIWVRGCYDHYIRWTLCETKRGGDACHEIEIEDCPEYIHHWYDHFYCERPCPGGRTRELAAV